MRPSCLYIISFSKRLYKCIAHHTGMPPDLSDLAAFAIIGTLFSEKNTEKADVGQGIRPAARSARTEAGASAAGFTKEIHERD